MEKSIIKSFDLEALSDSAFWTALINKDSINIPMFYSMLNNTQSLRNSVNKFSPLLERSADHLNVDVEGVNSTGGTKKIALSSLSLIIKDRNVPDLSVQNLIDLLVNIKNLYEIIVKLYKFDHTELFVGSIDSGSDKSIDIIGIAEAISRMSNLITETWDRIRFRKQQKLDKSLKSISDGITVLENIKSAIENTSITAEEGEKLKRGIIKSMDEIISNGVYTRDVEERKLPPMEEISVERRLMITYQEPPSGLDKDQLRQATATKSAKIRRPRTSKPKS